MTDEYDECSSLNDLEGEEDATDDETNNNGDEGVETDDDSDDDAEDDSENGTGLDDGDGSSLSEDVEDGETSQDGEAQNPATEVVTAKIQPSGKPLSMLRKAKVSAPAMSSDSVDNDVSSGIDAGASGTEDEYDHSSCSSDDELTKVDLSQPSEFANEMDSSIEVEAEAVEVVAEPIVHDEDSDENVSYEEQDSNYDDEPVIAVEVASTADNSLTSGNDLRDAPEAVAVAQVVVEDEPTKPLVKGKRKRTKTSRFIEATSGPVSKKEKRSLKGQRSGPGYSGKSTKVKKHVHKKVASVPKLDPSTRKKMKAALEARKLLTDIDSLPVNVQDIVVLDFGSVVVDPPPPPANDITQEAVKMYEDKYSSARAIHPVGFSCVRYEFSPVHNRVIKLRCEILQGNTMADDEGREDVGGTSGPLFRISWGKGIDEDNSDKIMGVKPFDIQESTPIMLGHDEDEERKRSEKIITPESGMRVKVRFDGKDWYYGSIERVTKKKKQKLKGVGAKKAGKRDKQWQLEIKYDDGQMEQESYPDPDIVLCPEKQATQRKVNDSAYKKLGTTPPTSTDITSGITKVYGQSPLEAWGKVLIHLGLIDEIIMEHSFGALADSRKQNLVEAKERIQAQKIQRQQARARERQRKKERSTVGAGTSESHCEDQSTEETAAHFSSEASARQAVEVSGQVITSDVANADVASKNMQLDGGGRTAKDEERLRSKVEELRAKYDAMQKQAHQTSMALANARLAAVGPFLSNPFQNVSCKQQANWLSTVIRKEKSKMGSTGNKRKIINSSDLLSRMDTFFNPEIEGLIEGLPGSELCPTYVFRACRGTGATAATQAWVHEAHVKAEKERERQRKAAKEAKLKKSQWLAKEQKRKERENQLEKRKQEKEEVEEQRRKKREEERLARLSLQVDDRLFKEACFQREKVVLWGQKAISRENLRRRKAAELVATHAVFDRERETGCFTSYGDLVTRPLSLPLEGELPPLSRRYDGDVVRVWDFVHSFKAAFLKLGVFVDDGSGLEPAEFLPSLDAFQGAIDAIRRAPSCCTQDEGRDTKKESSVRLLTDLAVTLCKPLASSLKKILSTVASAASAHVASHESKLPASEDPASIASIATVPSSKENSNQIQFPVNRFTWKEVAHLALLSDALLELGSSKPDAANILRGYRSGGHPNSKEARRLRRGEDSSLVMLRQVLADRPNALLLCLSPRDKGDDSVPVPKGMKEADSIKVKIPVPCDPSAFPSDWVFYLHNIKASNAVRGNLHKALALLKNPNSNVGNVSKDAIILELQKALKMVENGIGCSSSESIAACTRARQICLRVLDKVTGQMFSQDTCSKPYLFEDVVKTITNQKIKDKKNKVVAMKPVVRKASRQRMGMISFLTDLSRDEYNRAVKEREDYMAVAMKEQQKRDNVGDRKDGDDDDDDDDEDDDDDDEDAKTETESQADVSEAKRNVNDNISSEREKREESNEKDSQRNSAPKIEGRIGKETPYDNFCADDPSYPELIRRCLAVLRTLCMSPPGETFVYPVDPQMNPRYYETVIRPMCLQDIGVMLTSQGKQFSSIVGHGKAREHGQEEIESVVAQFARDVRLILSNCTCYSAVGAALVSDAEQLLRIFERLFLDWVLCPPHLLLPLEDLDDDLCVDSHPSDKDAMVLICDGCEGKFNMSRLDPPLQDVPTGDWYCPRCVTGRCWAHVDLRIGRKVRKALGSFGADVSDGVDEAASEKQNCSNECCMGIVTSVFSTFPDVQEKSDGHRAHLTYVVKYEQDLDEEYWTVEQVDAALKRETQFVNIDPPPRIRCTEAIAESPGYGTNGKDYGITNEILPSLVNPTISDAAAQAMVSSTTFAHLLRGLVTLMTSTPEELDANEWLQVLTLLASQATMCDEIIDEATNLENMAAEKLSKAIVEIGTVKTIEQVLDKYVKENVDCNVKKETEESFKEDNHTESYRKRDVKSPSRDSKVEPNGLANDKEEQQDRKSNKKRKLRVLFGDEGISDEEEMGSSSDDDYSGDKRKARRSEKNVLSDEDSSEAEWMDEAGGDQKNSQIKKKRKSEEEGIKSRGLGPLSEEKKKNDGITASVTDFEGSKGNITVKVNLADKTDPAMKTPKSNTFHCEPVSPGAAKDKAKLSPETCTSSAVVPVVSLSEEQQEETMKQDRSSALRLKAERSKAREDGYVAYSMKKQMSPTVAAFEEDAFSQVVDSVLLSKDAGLALESCVCTGQTCDFCGLPDEALGCPLMRVPTETEWMEILPHVARNRVMNLLADVSNPDESFGLEDEREKVDACIVSEAADLTLSMQHSANNARKLLSVTIRVGGKLLPSEKSSTTFQSIAEYGMLEFVPRNKLGFQNELQFRHSSSLPYMTGSLSAHECCAIAAHNARKDKVLQAYRDRSEVVAERDFGRLCGRALPFGMDNCGRSYWIFDGDRTSLFVCEICSEGQTNLSRWQCFSDPETIASVIVYLTLQRSETLVHDKQLLLVEEIKRIFPDAVRMIRQGNWSELLMKRRFAIKNSHREEDPTSQTRSDAFCSKDPKEGGEEIVSASSPTGSQVNQDLESEQNQEQNQGWQGEELPDDIVPYEEGEDVLVESLSGKLLWDASVVAVSKHPTKGKVNGYRVHYKQWSSRFDEWVVPLRVVEPTDHNLAVQEELMDEYVEERERIPDCLDFLFAKNYICSKKRARGSRPPTSLANALAVGPGASSDDKQLALLKAALLTVETALPQSSVDTSNSGSWKPQAAAYWRSMVEKANGPASLMGCVVLLEDSIAENWLWPEAKHLLSALPKHWKAISDASVSSVAMRVCLIDSAIMYGASGRSLNIGRGRRSR